MEEVKEVPKIERESLYDWASIFDGKLNMLTKGKDFDCSTTSFASNARTTAERLGVKVEVCSIRKEQVFVKGK